jgi:hypothetical protein
MHLMLKQTKDANREILLQEIFEDKTRKEMDELRAIAWSSQRGDRVEPRLRESTNRRAAI